MDQSNLNDDHNSHAPSKDAVPAHPWQPIAGTIPEQIIKLSPNGETYFAPWALRGTRVAKVEEGTRYWDSSWSSLQKYLENESSENRLKEQAQAAAREDPGNEKLKGIAKRHGDNCSKQKKISQIFGPNSQHQYHPNQVVAARHLPLGGLCGDQDVMYHMACKISDLAVLSIHGELEMDPFDFFRWRLSVALQDKVKLGMGSANQVIRGVIHRLGSEEGDPVFREMILRSFHLQKRNCPVCHLPDRKNSSSKLSSGQQRSRPASALSAQGSRLPSSVSASTKHAQERAEARRARRAKREQDLRDEGAQDSQQWRGINQQRASMDNK